MFFGLKARSAGLPLPAITHALAASALGEELGPPFKRGRGGLPPDWACEVLSPSTAGVDRVRKARIYARERVQHVWLVDPAEKLLEVWRLDMYCDDSNMCAETRSEGSPCGSFFECKTGLLCNSGTCTRMTMAGVGAPCVSNDSGD